jgi:putative ABC transport system ATP-binding protein
MTEDQRPSQTVPEVVQRGGVAEETSYGVTTRPAAAVGPQGTRIDLDDVYREYRVGDTTVTALADVNLHVDETAFVVVLGASGSGKTTLLNVIGALDAPTGGRVRINGVDITSVGRRERAHFRRHTVSFIFQSFNLFPALTAAENVQFGADVAGVPDAATVAADMLARVGLGDRGRHFAHQLSGGEQQRVAIARALATGNPVLLADEPTGELDFRTGVRILELLQAQAEAGKTVLVVTHNREISRVADRVIELSSGRIVADGPPAGGRADVADLRW